MRRYILITNNTMNRIKPQTQSTHLVIQFIKDFIGKIRQNPDVYPIRYYKKNRKFQRNFEGTAIK